MKLTDDHVDTNFELQRSGYYTSRDGGGGQPLYYSSTRIPSTNWNHAHRADPGDPQHVEFISGKAEERGLAPAFFVRERDLARIADFSEANTLARERWMLCDYDTIAKSPSTIDTHIEFTSEAIPSNDYLSVLSNMYEDEALNNRFRNFYIPTLQNASLINSTKCIHATLYYDNSPVSCGSVYLNGPYAGLYNVGTRYGSGRRGFGALVSWHLTNEALRAGAADVFLQCVIGTHVERLYANLGYQSVEMPGILIMN
ncbi:MAG: hypothetical protein AAF642_00725 [Pseudomonadota bacterium]